MLGVGDQDRFGGEGSCLGDLPEDPGSVEEWLALEGAIARAFVDDDAVTKGIEIHPQDLGDDETLGDARCRIAQSTQAQVLLLEVGQAHQLEIRIAHANCQLRILLLQALTGCEDSCSQSQNAAGELTATCTG